MQQVFRDAAQMLDIHYEEECREEDASNLAPGIYLDHHCHFPQSLLNTDMRGFRIIRDPRDVVISGAHYHVRSDEAWLSRPSDLHDGQSYQAALSAHVGWPERYAFEMQWVAKATTGAMIEDADRLPEAIQLVRYEDLMSEDADETFRALIISLGFDAQEQDALMRSFERHSLRGASASEQSAHVRSGKIAQWKHTYTRALGEAFLTAMGDALIVLGYENDHSWVQALPGE